MNSVKLHDKSFNEYISEELIRNRVDQLAFQVNDDLKGTDLLLLGILNGSFIFIADLMREISIPVQVSFLKVASYSGTQSTGIIKELIGLGEDIKGKTVVIVEDIVDTGRTLNRIIKDLDSKGAEQIKVASLLVKPDAYKGDHQIDYIGFEIPDEFVVGYGLDYDGLGRNYRSIYKIAD